MQSLQLDPWPWPTAGELLANLDSSEGWTGGEGGEGEKEEDGLGRAVRGGQCSPAAVTAGGGAPVEARWV